MRTSPARTLGRNLNLWMVIGLAAFLLSPLAAFGQRTSLIGAMRKRRPSQQDQAAQLVAQPSPATHGSQTPAAAEVNAMLQQAANTKVVLTSEELRTIVADPYWDGDTIKDVKKSIKHCDNANYVWRDAGQPYSDAAGACDSVASMLWRSVGISNPEVELALQRACALPHYPGIVGPIDDNYCAELGDLYRARVCAVLQFSEMYSSANYSRNCKVAKAAEADQVRAQNLALALAVYQNASNCHASNFTPQHRHFFEMACPIGAADVLLAQGQMANGGAAMRSACRGFSISGGAPGDCLGFMPQPAQQAESADATDSGSQSASDQRQETQDKIDSLNNEIQQLESDANDADQNADNLATNSNCTGGYGPYAAIAQQGCENINSIGVAKFRSEAAKDRNQADDDRSEIERLQGEEVQEAPHRDASFGGALAQQMQQNPQPSIVDTANQQAANMIAVGAANDAARAQSEMQQRQQAAQARQQAQQAAQQTSTSNDRAPAVGAVPQAPPSGPVQVIFRPLTSSAAGHAVVSVVGGTQRCPPDCSFTFAQYGRATFSIQADGNSIYRGVQGNCVTGGGTAPETPGNSGGCSLAAAWLAQTVTVLVDTAQQAQQAEQAAPSQRVPDLPAGCITVSESDREEANFGAWVFTNNCGVRVLIAVTAPPNPQVTGNPYDVYQNDSLDVGQSLRGPLANQRYKYFACPSPFAPYDSSTSAGNIVNPSFETTKTVCLQVDASGDIIAH